MGALQQAPSTSAYGAYNTRCALTRNALQHTTHNTHLHIYVRTYVCTYTSDELTLTYSAIQPTQIQAIMFLQLSQHAQGCAMHEAATLALPGSIH